MNSPLPPLDTHAHININIHPRALLSLRAVILVALRSQDDFDHVFARDDPLAIWGVGIHPGSVAPVQAFDSDRLRSQLDRTPLLSEIGLDRRSPVPPAAQEAVFRQALDAHDKAACIASVHSAGRTGRVLEILEDHRCSTVVLHWWNGTAEQTRRALALGCYFSVNIRNLRTASALHLVPPDRILPETDHPYGNRKPRSRPGNVGAVEGALAEQPYEFRFRVWRNFGQLMDNAGATERLPTKVQGLIAAASSGGGHSGRESGQPG